MVATRYALAAWPQKLLSLDRCWIFIGITLLLLGMFIPDQAVDSVRFLLAAPGFAIPSRSNGSSGTTGSAAGISLSVVATVRCFWVSGWRWHFCWCIPADRATV